ncbi:MAG: hypothetical protein GY838_08355 [bacterium]|nr:hypothetical protein [bacterium]
MNRLQSVIVLVLLGCLVSTLPASAQSPFALTNIGQRIQNEDARMVARGFGMTVTDTMHPGFKNLASLAGLRHVAVGFTGYGERVKAEDSAGSRTTYRTFTPDLRVAFPAMKGRMALSAGFSIERSTNYRTGIDNTWYAWDDTLVGDERFIREGSIFTVPLGVAYRVGPSLAVSASLNLVRGTMRESLGHFYTEPASSLGRPFYQATGRVDEDKYYGTSSTVSFLFTPDGGRLRLAASYTPSYDIRIERKVELNGVAERADTEHQMTMPEALQAGFEFGLNKRWRVGGDALLQRFSSYEGREDWAAAMEDEYRVTAGVERVRGTERRGGAGNLPLRLSGAYQKWGYRIGGEPVEELSFSAGTGFPFGHDMGQLDVALTWGKIGDLGTNGLQSDLWRVTVSVTGLEAWW